jgi:uncharacterized protein YodC (DUF2158 family)
MKFTLIGAVAIAARNFSLPAFTKWAPHVAALTLAAALSVPLPIPAFSEPAPPSTAMKNRTAGSFERGELVRLRSGGPAMTVNSINGDQVDCYWTDSSGQPNADKFPISVLQKFIFSFAFS